MFRDESNKVMQKAHAQWGVNDAPEPITPMVASSTSPAPSSSSSSSSGSSAGAPSPMSNRRFSHTSSSPLPSQSSSPTVAAISTSNNIAPLSDVYPSISPSLEDQGVQFYINRYLLGHPDEPKTTDELAACGWLWSPELQDVRIAVGLAGLSNLKSDHDLMTTARHRYGIALRRTGQLIQQPDGLSLEAIMRAVVLLAMFEVSVSQSFLHQIFQLQPAATDHGTARALATC